MMLDGYANGSLVTHRTFSLRWLEPCSPFYEVPTANLLCFAYAFADRLNALGIEALKGTYTAESRVARKSEPKEVP